MSDVAPDDQPAAPADPRALLHARIDRDFVYHAPKGNQGERYGILRATTGVLAHEFVRHCPPSRELSLALTSLEEAVFWANAAIARNE